MYTERTAMLEMAQQHIDEQIRFAEHSRLARQVERAERRSTRPVSGRRRAARLGWVVPASTSVGSPR
jgi:hypothetical protein